MRAVDAPTPRVYHVYLCELYAGYSAWPGVGMRIDAEVKYESVQFSKALSNFGSGSIRVDEWPYLPRPYETGICIAREVPDSIYPKAVYTGIIQDDGLRGGTSGDIGFIELAKWLDLTATKRDLRFDQVREIDILQALVADVGYRNPGVIISRQAPIPSEMLRDRSYDAGQNIGDAVTNMSKVIAGQQFRTVDEIVRLPDLELEIAQTRVSYGWTETVAPQLVTNRIANFDIDLSASGSRNRVVSTVEEGEGDDAVRTTINRTSYRDAHAIDFAKSFSAGSDLSMDAVIDDLDGNLTVGRLGQVELSMSSRHELLLDTLPGQLLDVRVTHPYPLETRALITEVQTTISRGQVEVSMATQLPEGTDL